MGKQDDLPTPAKTPRTMDSHTNGFTANLASGFATDKEALEAYIGVVVTRSVSWFEIVCDWVGTSTQDTDLPTGYDPERLYDAQTGSTFRLDGLSYGPWVDDPLQLDSYNAVHVWLPAGLRYVTVMLCDLPAGMAVSAPKGYLHWQYHPCLARTAKTLFRTSELDLRNIDEALGTTRLQQRLSSLIDRHECTGMDSISVPRRVDTGILH